MRLAPLSCLLGACTTPLRHPPLLASEALDLSQELDGRSLSPSIPVRSTASVLLRYIYEGGALSKGRLCTVDPASSGVVTGVELLSALQADGVDLGRFYACAYEFEESGGGWLPVLRDVTNPLAAADDPIRIATVPLAAASEEPTPHKPKPKRRRIDVKLCRRDVPSLAERGASSAPKGKIERGGFAALGVVGAKTEENVGTLWRSAFQLGAAFIFTVNARYAPQRTDTLKVPTRLPLLHFADWSAFAAAAPHGALLVGVEMGGVPLEEFEHPERAVYVLGSEDTGLPASVAEACHEVVSISSERYASFNVAMAGSIVLHDRLAKRKLAEKSRGAES